MSGGAASAMPSSPSSAAASWACPRWPAPLRTVTRTSPGRGGRLVVQRVGRLGAPAPATGETLQEVTEPAVELVNTMVQVTMLATASTATSTVAGTMLRRR